MNALYHYEQACRWREAQTVLLADRRPRYEALRKAVRMFGSLDRNEVAQALGLLDEIFDTGAADAVIAAVVRQVKPLDVYGLRLAIARLRAETGLLAAAEGRNVHDFIGENPSVDGSLDVQPLQAGHVAVRLAEKLDEFGEGFDADHCGGKVAGHVQLESEAKVGAYTHLDLGENTIVRGVVVVGGEIAGEQGDFGSPPSCVAPGEVAFVQHGRAPISGCNRDSQVDAAESVNADEDWSHRDFLNAADAP